MTSRPVTSVDFAGSGLAGLDKVSDYEAPHRIFGGWDSTGPRGGSDAKYERAITSEIVALDIKQGAGPPPASTR